MANRFIKILFIAALLPGFAIAEESGFLEDYSILGKAGQYGAARMYVSETAIQRMVDYDKIMIDQPWNPVALAYARLTGRWTYGDLWELILSHDPHGPLQIAFDPQDIDLLKDFPYLTTLHVYSPQREETIVRLADIDSLELVGLHMVDANDAGVVTLKKLRPDLKVVTKWYPPDA